MTRSLRRTLAVRFAATMGVGLLAVAAAALYASHLFFTHHVDPGLIQAVIAPALLGVVLLLTGATFVGAWWLAGSAVRPVAEITEQATRVEAGTLSQRIVAHAETGEYRGLVAVLNRMLERLEEAFRNQRRLTADVSHELRSPLTALRGEIEVALRAERTPRDYQRVLHSALEEIERLTEMSENMLLITRIDAGLVEAQREPMAVNEIVDRSLAWLHTRMEERGLRVDRCLAANGAPASLDRELIEHVVRHLLENAVKFTPAEGMVRVATAPLDCRDGGVRLSVEDSGPGIRPENLPRIFEPFYRADEARSRGTGTGLGLAMVAAIVRLHGGAIRVSNVATGGARFEVDLPAPSPAPGGSP